MRLWPNKFPASVWYVLALAGLVAAVGATKIAGFDIWWHIKTGEVIWLWRQIPRQDIFSYTAFGLPWVNHEWLFQVIVWFLYSWLGVASLTVLKFILTCGIVFFVFRTFNVLTSSRSAALWGAVILLWAMADRILARPFLFSLFFISLFCYLLHSFTSEKRKTLWVLPLLQIIWINLHGQGLLGPLLIGAFALGESLQCFGGLSPLNGKCRHHLWTVALLSLGACLVNPRGADLFIFPFTHLKMEAILLYTQEWLPALDPRLDGIISQIAFRITLVAVFISFIINVRRTRISHLLLLVLTSVMILKGKRFTTDFIIINLPLTFYNLKPLVQRIFLQRKYYFEWGSVALVTIISILALRYGVPLTLQSGAVNSLGVGVESGMAPARLVEFLDENKIGGKVFNDMGVGGYLIFRRWPEEKVFIDGRTPVYGDDFYRSIVESFVRSQNFEKLDKLYNFDYLVFKGYGAWDLRYLHKYLWENPNWRLVYCDINDGMVYVRQKPEFGDVIKRYAFKRHPLVEVMPR